MFWTDTHLIKVDKHIHNGMKLKFDHWEKPDLQTLDKLDMNYHRVLMKYDNKYIYMYIHNLLYIFEIQFSR